MAKPKIVKCGPRTAATRALWEEADRRWLLKDHPEDCAVCAPYGGAGMNSSDWVVEHHKQYWMKLTFQSAEAAKRRKAASEAYYDGGLKLVIGGAPVRVAAHVAKWKSNNQKMLGLGFDRFGLTLRPHNKRGFTDDAGPRRALETFNYIGHKVLAHVEYDEFALSPQMRVGYSVVAGKLFRKQQWFHGERFSEHMCSRALPYSSRKDNRAFRPAPDLWSWARIERRRVACQN